MQIYAVRGATTLSADTPEAMNEALEELLPNLLQANQIQSQAILAVFFTITPDITAYNPAQAARTICSDWQAVAMLCSQEAVVTNMMARCVRVLIQWQSSSTDLQPKPVYLRQAKILRPEWQV